MSLRAPARRWRRAAVALIALAVAGVATYSALLPGPAPPDRRLAATGPRADRAGAVERSPIGRRRRRAGRAGHLRRVARDLRPPTLLAIPLREPGHEPATVDLDQLRRRDVAGRDGGRDADPAVYRTRRRHRERGPVAAADLVARRRQRAVRRPAAPRHRRGVTPPAAHDRARRHGRCAGRGRRPSAGCSWSAGLRPLRRVEQHGAGGRRRRRARSSAPPVPTTDNEVGRLAAR